LKAAGPDETCILCYVPIFVVDTVTTTITTTILKKQKQNYSFLVCCEIEVDVKKNRYSV
jgi:hypothetical protein